MVSINDLFNQWQQSIEKAQSKDVEDSREDELLDVEGMRVRSDVTAGSPYSPKMTLYSGCPH